MGLILAGAWLKKETDCRDDTSAMLNSLAYHELVAMTVRRLQ
jgi:hypothetical protein